MAAISLTQKLEGKKKKNKQQTKPNTFWEFLKEKYTMCPTQPELAVVRHAPSIIRFVFQVHCVVQFLVPASD